MYLTLFKTILVKVTGSCSKKSPPWIELLFVDAKTVFILIFHDASFFSIRKMNIRWKERKKEEEEKKIISPYLENGFCRMNEVYLLARIYLSIKSRKNGRQFVIIRTRSIRS